MVPSIDEFHLNAVASLSVVVPLKVTLVPCTTSWEDIEFICENNDNVFVDTKKKLGKWLNSATYVKINDLEYKNSFETIDNISKEKLIITQGKNGCIYNDEVFPVEEVTVKDVSGAGDTFLASLAVNYVKSNDIKKSIKFAQKCATLVVQKHGVVTV